MRRQISKTRTYIWFLSLGLFSKCVQGDQIPPEPPGYVDCSFCSEPGHVPQLNYSAFSSGKSVYSCQNAFELGVLRLPQENCTFWQSRGASICGCASEAPPENNCTLCEDGSSLPEPLMAGVPGKLCAQLQAEAKWDEPENCVVWQQTIGVYCGCGNPQATAVGQEVCRICGEGDEVNLPDPLLAVPLLTDLGEETSSSCGQLEFEANLFGASCDQYQIFYSKECCTSTIEEPESTDDDGTYSQSVHLSGLVAILVVFMARH
jgi:hypothetical protein